MGDPWTPEGWEPEDWPPDGWEPEDVIEGIELTSSFGSGIVRKSSLKTEHEFTSSFGRGIVLTSALDVEL